MSRHARVAFAWSVPIGAVGGLIGLGGAEFRLPVLVGVLRHPPFQAVVLNLLVSLVTVGVALAVRWHALPGIPLRELLPALLPLTAASVAAAVVGVRYASRLSRDALERVILVLLVAIGVLLVVEGLLPGAGLGPLLPPGLAWRVGGGLVFGAAIGLVSSLLGVAGGELIIPTLVFAYGVDIRVAGTAALLVSLPTVAAGIWRYAAGGAYHDRAALRGTAAPMGAGSVIGAAAGGLLAGLAPVALLKLGLGMILIYSAARVFRATRSRVRARE